MNNNNNYSNPLETAKDIEKIVVSGSMRKYFEFKEPLFEGDLCCADIVGCNLSCIYCNSGTLIENPDRVGEFYSPEDAAEKIVRFNSKSARISGGEPTIGKEHLLELLNLIPKNLTVILETNGTLIDRNYAHELSPFENLHVMVSLKGTTPEEFQKITLCDKSGFFLQINALKNLIDAGISANPAIINIVNASGIDKLSERLEEIDKKLAIGLEYERLIKTKNVIENLAKHGVFAD